MFLIYRMFSLAACLALGPQAAWCAELLENGSFEDDGTLLAGLPSATGWNDGRSVGNDVGFTPVKHIVVECDDDGCQEIDDMFAVAPGELPEPFGMAAVKPNGAGQMFGTLWGSANGFGTLGSATQIVSVIDHQGQPYAFSAWLSSRSNAPPLNDTDYAIVSVEFFSEANGSGESLASAIFDGNDSMSTLIVGSLNAEGVADPAVPATQDNWTSYRATGIIPEFAQSAAIVIRGATISGSGRSGYVDLVSLQVVPEPTSVILLAMCVPVLLVCRSRHSSGHRSIARADTC
jgi:hypothetical protein